MKEISKKPTDELRQVLKDKQFIDILAKHNNGPFKGKPAVWEDFCVKVLVTQRKWIIQENMCECGDKSERRQDGFCNLCDKAWGIGADPKNTKEVWEDLPIVSGENIKVKDEDLTDNDIDESCEKTD